MMIEVMKSKIHRAKITSTDINYEGSITLDRKLCEKAKLREFEKVDVYNVTNGNRFTTYVIYGKNGEVQINGAAARLCSKGDIIIIVSYAIITEEEYSKFKPTVVIMKN